MLEIQYRCIQCGSDKPDEFRGMLCECGGDYRPQGQMFGQAPIFDAYFNRVLGQECSSYHDEDKKIKQFNKQVTSGDPKFKCRSHPEGVSYANDQGWFKEAKKDSKHGKEIVREHQRKHGTESLNQGQKRLLGIRDRKKVFISALLVMFLSVPAFAKLTGIDWVSVIIKDKSYELPIYHPNIKEQVYLILKAIKYKDPAAREMLLAGKDEVLIYIGDGDVSRWLKITQTGQEVIER